MKIPGQRRPEALLETHFQSNSKAWSSVTFLALGGTNDISLITACFGVTSLSMKWKNSMLCSFNRFDHQITQVISIRGVEQATLMGYNAQCVIKSKLHYKT